MAKIGASDESGSSSGGVSPAHGGDAVHPATQSADSVSPKAPHVSNTNDPIDSSQASKAALEEYRKATQEQSLAWRAIDALSRNWNKLKEKTPASSPQNSLTHKELDQAVRQADLSDKDRKLLTEFLSSKGAFSYVDRLSGKANGAVQRDTLARYADIKDAAQAIKADAGALDGGSAKPGVYRPAGRDGQVSWADIVARRQDPRTPAAQKAKLKAIDQDMFRILSGGNPYIQLGGKQGAQVVAAPSAAELTRAAQTLISDWKALDVADNKAKTAADGKVSWSDIKARIRALPEGSALRQRLSQIDENTFNRLNGDRSSLIKSDVSKFAQTNAAAQGPRSAAATPPARIRAQAQAGKASENQVKTVLAYGVALDAASSKGKGELDGKFTKSDVGDMLAKKQLPQDLRQALRGLLNNNAAGFNKLDGLDGKRDGVVNIRDVSALAKRSMPGVDSKLYERGRSALDATRRNGAYLDSVSKKGGHDGKVGGGEIAAALAGSKLKAADKAALSAVGKDKSLGAALDLVDGKRDQGVQVASPRKTANKAGTKAAKAQAKLDPKQVESVLSYGIALDAASSKGQGKLDGHFTERDVGDMLAKKQLPQDLRESLSGLLKNGKAGFNQLDGLDGKTDGSVKLGSVVALAKRSMSGVDANSYQRGRSALEAARRNGAYLDNAGKTGDNDGKVGGGAIRAALAGNQLKSGDKAALSVVKKDKALYAALDLVDGKRDQGLKVGNPAKPQSKVTAKQVDSVLGYGIALDAASSKGAGKLDGKFTRSDIGDMLAKKQLPRDLRQSLNGLLGNGGAGFRKLDGLDGKTDGSVKLGSVAGFSKRNMPGVDAGRYDSARKALTWVRNNTGVFDHGAGRAIGDGVARLAKLKNWRHAKAIDLVDGVVDQSLRTGLKGTPAAAPAAPPYQAVANRLAGIVSRIDPSGGVSSSGRGLSKRDLLRVADNPELPINALDRAFLRGVAKNDAIFNALASMGGNNGTIYAARIASGGGTSAGAAAPASAPPVVGGAGTAGATLGPPNARNILSTTVDPFAKALSDLSAKPATSMMDYLEWQRDNNAANPTNGRFGTQGMDLLGALSSSDPLWDQVAPGTSIQDRERYIVAAKLARAPENASQLSAISPSGVFEPNTLPDWVGREGLGRTGTFIEGAWARLLDEYGRSSDARKTELAELFNAKSALTLGLPLPKGTTFDTRIDGDSVGRQLLDAGVVDQKLRQAIANPEVQRDLGKHLRDLLANEDQLANAIANQLSRPQYANAILQMQSSGQSATAAERVSEDLGVLRMLDEARATRIQGELQANLAVGVINSGNFANTPQKVAAQSINDLLLVASGLRGAQTGVRMVGHLQSLADNFHKIGPEWEKFKGDLGGLSNSLAKAFRVAQTNGVSIASMSGITPLLDSPQASSAMSGAERAQAKGFLSTLNRTGLLGVAAGAFGVAAGAYRLANPPDSPGYKGTPQDRMAAALPLVAAASYAQAYAKAGVTFANALGDVGTASKFSDALDRSVFDLAKAAPSGMTPKLALTLKGVVAAADIAGGALGIALGAHQISQGVANNSVLDKALGGATVAGGAITAGAGIAALAGASIAAPLFVFGGVVAGAVLIAQLVTQKTPSNQYGDALEEKWGKLGVLKDGWRDNLNSWWNGREAYERRDTAIFGPPGWGGFMP